MAQVGWSRQLRLCYTRVATQSSALQEERQMDNEIFQKIEGHLQDMEASQRLMQRDVESLSRNVSQSLNATVELRGTFASIQGILGDHETRIAALERKQAS